MYITSYYVSIDNRRGSWYRKRVGTPLRISGRNRGMLGFKSRSKRGDIERNKKDGNDCSIRVSVCIIIFSFHKNKYKIK